MGIFEAICLSIIHGFEVETCFYGFLCYIFGVSDLYFKSKLRTRGGCTQERNKQQKQIFIFIFKQHKIYNDR